MHIHKLTLGHSARLTAEVLRLTRADAFRVSKEQGGCMAMRTDEKVTKP